MVYDKLYLFFTMGDKIFREELLAYPTKTGNYHIHKDSTVAYSFFKFNPPTVTSLDVVELEPFKLVRYYPMFSKSDSFEHYITLMKHTKREEVEYYQDKITELLNHINKDYICEDVEKENKKT